MINRRSSAVFRPQRHVVSVVAALVASLSWGTPVQGATTGPGELMDLDLESLMEVTVVTPSRGVQRVIDSPRSVSVITGEDLRRHNNRTLPEALNELVGVWVQESNYGAGSPILRGLLGNRVLILVDGVRLNNGVYGLDPNQYLNTIDLYQVERVEVVRGTGSVLYGSDALGGVINIITKEMDPADHAGGTGGRLFLRRSSADHGTSGRVGLSGVHHHLGYVGGVSLKRFGDLRGGSSVGVQPHTGYREWDGDLKLTLRLSSHYRFDLALQHVQQRGVESADKIASGIDIKRRWDPESRDLCTLRYTFDGGWGVVDSAVATLSFQEQREVWRRVTAALPSREHHHFDRVRTLGTTIQLHSSIGQRQGITYGLEYYKDRITSERSDVDLITGLRTEREGKFADGAGYDSLGIFAEGEIHFGDDLSLLLGSRYSAYHMTAAVEDPATGRIDVDTTSRAVTSSMFAVYQIRPGLVLDFGVSQGFRAPNVDDTSVLGSFGSGFEVPNLDLVPEWSLDYEVGLKHHGSRMSGSIYLLRSDFKQVIERGKSTYKGLDFLDANGNGVRDPGEETVFRRENEEDAYLVGVEGDLRYRLIDGWTIDANVAWYRGEEHEGEGEEDEPMRRIPPLNGRFGVEWQPRSTAWMELFTLFAGRQDRLESRDITDPSIGPGGTPGFATINLRAGYDLDRVGRFTVALENLTDRSYRLHGSGIDAPGFNAVLGYERSF